MNRKDVSRIVEACIMFELMQSPANDHPGKVKRKDFSRIVEDKLWENALSLATRLCLHFFALPNAVAVQEWWRLQ